MQYINKYVFIPVVLLVLMHVHTIVALKNSFTVGSAWKQFETSYLPSTSGNILQQLDTESWWNMYPVLSWAADVEFSEHFDGGLDIGAGFLRHGRGAIRADIFQHGFEEDLRSKVLISATGGDVAAHIGFLTKPMLSLSFKWLLGYQFAREFATLTTVGPVLGDKHRIITERVKNKGFFVGIIASRKITEQISISAAYACSWTFSRSHSSENLDSTSALALVNLIGNSVSLGLIYAVLEDLDLKGHFAYSASKNSGRGRTIGFNEKGRVVSSIDNLFYQAAQKIIMSVSCAYSF